MKARHKLPWGAWPWHDVPQSSVLYKERAILPHFKEHCEKRCMARFEMLRCYNSVSRAEQNRLFDICLCLCLVTDS